MTNQPNFDIKSTGRISKEFVDRNILTFNQATLFVKELAYGRNADKNNLASVFADNCGTCSTKHALIKRLADENNFETVKLIVGLFRMNKINTPEISATLLQNKVSVLDNLLYEERYLRDVEFFNVDVRNIEELSKIIHNYDTVIVLAGLVGDAACAVDPSMTRDINITHVKWVADNYKGKIVYTSTCSVYGKNDDLIDETATPNPLSVYAETKLEAEQY